MAHPASPWLRPGEPPPGPKAPAAEVASHLCEIIDPQYLLSRSVVSQRALLREICEAYNQDYGWYWPQVSRALRLRAIANRSHSHDVDAVEWTPSDIPIFTDCFAEPQPICQFKHKTYDMAHRRVRYEDRDCDSPSERRCGPRLADELLQRVKARMTPADEIYIAEAEWASGLMNRMTQRRHANGYNTFTYTDVDGKVSFVADGRMHGVDPPRTSELVSLDDAIEWVTPRLWVPGYRDASFSAGWACPSGRSTAGGSQISLDGLTDDQVKEFVRRADIIMASVEVPLGSVVPPERWDHVRDALIAMRQELKTGD